MLGSFSRQIRRESVKSFGKTRSCGNYSYSRRYMTTGSMLRASSISTRFVLPVGVFFNLYNHQIFILTLSFLKNTFANDFKGLGRFYFCLFLFFSCFFDINVFFLLVPCQSVRFYSSGDC